MNARSSSFLFALFASWLLGCAPSGGDLAHQLARGVSWSFCAPDRPSYAPPPSGPTALLQLRVGGGVPSVGRVTAYCALFDGEKLASATVDSGHPSFDVSATYAVAARGEHTVTVLVLATGTRELAGYRFAIASSRSIAGPGPYIPVRAILHEEAAERPEQRPALGWIGGARP